MPRRRSSKRKSESTKSAPSTRRKRRRRRPRSNTQASGTKTSQPTRDGNRSSGDRAGRLDLPPLAIGRAPRKVQPPPPNPRVFSYTYTIWKTT